MQITTTLREDITGVTKPTGARMLIRLIDAGWGSSGYYSEAALLQAAGDRVWPAGKHMYIDHPGRAEAADRPERTIRDLAAVLTEDARYDLATNALVAEAYVYEHWRAPLADMHADIGVSIRGVADAHDGEVDGRAGVIIDRLTEGLSVDFVTHAGRGGRVLQVLESATAAHEATADQTRQGISAALKATHPNRWVWIRDYDPDLGRVWFEAEFSADTDEDQGGALPPGLYQQDFTTAGDTVTLTGAPIPVRPVTTYQPINVPTDPAGRTTTPSEEDTMPQIEEARLRQLEEDAGRVGTLTTERDDAIERATTAEAALAEANTAADAATAARIIAEAGHPFTALETRGLLAGAPTTSEGRLDVDAFTDLVTREAATAAEAAGAGTVRGLGNTTTGPDDAEDLSEADLDAQLAALSGRTVKGA